jgi:hypothetical protein
MRKKITALILGAVVSFCGVSSNRADILYNNGPVISHTTGHVSGLGVSLLESNTLLDGTLGFGAGQLANNAQHLRLMDDFSIPTGETWRLTGANLFGYQAGSGLVGMNGATLRIWSGNPASGGTLVYGDTFTNVLESQQLIGYRISQRTQAGPIWTDTSRPIWELLLGMDVILGEGQYWLDWSITGGFNPNFSVFSPPVTIPGQGVTAEGGPALQFNALTNTYTTNLRHSLSNNAVDLPFILRGTAIPELSATSMTTVLGILFISILIGRRTRIDVPHQRCQRPKHLQNSNRLLRAKEFQAAAVSRPSRRWKESVMTRV